MNEKKLNDKQKLEELLAYFRLKKSDFAQKTGILPQQIFDIMRGHISKLSRDNMEKIISAFPDISPYWLITGAGPMLTSDSVRVTIANNGDNINSNNVNANLDKLIDLSVSQQRTIENLVTLLKK